MLTSTSNPTVKHLVRMRDNRSRRRAGRVIVDGWREAWQAFQAGLEPVGVFVSGEAVTIEQQRVVQAAGESITQVSPAVMEKIAYGQSSRGVVAEFEAPGWGLEHLKCNESSLFLILDHFEKPGNVGATFRCADAAGADAVLLTPSGTDRFNPNAIRSSLGAVFSMQSAVADETDARAWLIERGFRILAARVEASAPLWQADLTGRVAIVIGSEAHGLGEHWQSDTRGPIDGVQIPMAGSIDSLNASVSAAVLLYEAARQRG